MRPRELMINDWVYDNENECYWQHNIKDYRCEHRILSSFDPIPLTEEILTANGWKVLSNFDRETYYSENGEFNLDFHNGKFRLIIHSHVVIIEYVHELQRALRCCGLWDLADNFKV